MLINAKANDKEGQTKTRPSPPRGGVSSVGVADEMSQEGFIQSLEEDARERAERRKERERKGRAAKKQGNEMFKQGHFEIAIKHFTEGIKETPWDVTLYTNRALVSAHSLLGGFTACYWKLMTYDEG